MRYLWKRFPHDLAQVLMRRSGEDLADIFHAVVARRCRCFYGNLCGVISLSRILYLVLVGNSSYCFGNVLSEKLLREDRADANDAMLQTV